MLCMVLVVEKQKALQARTALNKTNEFVLDLPREKGYWFVIGYSSKYKYRYCDLYSRLRISDCPRDPMCPEAEHKCS